jgi:hypothetical protein
MCNVIYNNYLRVEFDCRSNLKMTSEPLLITVTDKPFYVFTNPSFSELSKIGPLLRFTAD